MLRQEDKKMPHEFLLIFASPFKAITCDLFAEWEPHENQQSVPFILNM